MPGEERSLHLDDDPRHQRRFWIAERVAWVIFCLVIAVAAAGLLGSGGPLSRGRVEGASMVLDHPAVGRRDAADEMTLEIHGASNRATLPVELDAAFLRLFRIEEVRPTPFEEWTAGDRVHLTFRLGEGDGAAPAFVYFHVRPVTTSIRQPVTIRAGRETLTFRPVILP